MTGACYARLPDGRLHLQHGPIDVIVECWGEREEVRLAYEQCWGRFQGVLEELVGELPRLREPVGCAYPLLRGAVARRMGAAVWPHRDVFVTPMAAVAGAVADELMKALLEDRAIRKALVNDGGDIAVHVSSPAESIDVGIVNDPTRPRLNGSFRVRQSCGIATSGWRGRSQSLGIADAATVIARTAAQADAAATMIANALNVDHPAIERRAARSVKEDSDLGDLPVTVAVGPLPGKCVDEALRRGLEAACLLQQRNLIAAACMALQGRTIATPGLLESKLSVPTRSLAP